MSTAAERFAELGVVPVVVLEDAKDAAPLAKALVEGGLPCAEVTFRTDAAEESIKIMASEYPDMFVGAGTVLTIDQVDRAVAAAVKQTVKDSQIENQTSITSDQEMVAQFIQNVCTGIVSDGDLQIQIMGVDYKEGMLDVLVTEQFSYFNGKKAQISIRKCAVYE